MSRAEPGSTHVAAGNAAATGPQAGNETEKAPGAVARRKSWRLKRMLLLAGLYSTIALTVLFSIELIRYTIRFPDPRALSINEAGPTIRILARDGSLLALRGDKAEFVHLDRMPRHLVNAVIAVEDRRFHSHWGIDPSGLARALLANLKAGRTVQGGSTLTQQLAKNLFLSTERTLSRKLEELVLSFWLELRLSKKEILELYLNRVYFGGGAYGVEAAARRFFNKPAQAVNVGEAAVIAGLLKAPSKYSPFANPGLARGRARVVLRAMKAAGYLSPVAYVSAVRKSVQFADPDKGQQPTGLEYAIDHVLDDLPQAASVGNREIIVETTIDPDLQKKAQAVVSATLAKHGKSANVDQAALVVLDTSGGIRAMVGGASFAQSQFNRAVKARRQPGSAFKPFVYLAAVEQGLGADAVINDAPVSIDGWSPRNYDGRYRGLIPLRTALAHSVNTVAVRLQQDIGASKVAAVAQRLGIRSELRPDASMALGTSEVGLTEITAAYGVLAAGGAQISPHAVVRVRVANGPVLLEQKQATPRMLVAPDSVGVMNTMLNGVLVSGTGQRAALPRHQAAGKTGTTQDFRDAWFVGYTAHLVAGVWFGNDDGKSMNRVTGGGLPADVWRAVMEAAHQGLVPRALPAIDPSRQPIPVASQPARELRLLNAATARVADPVTALPPLPRRKPAKINAHARLVHERPAGAARGPKPAPANKPEVVKAEANVTQARSATLQMPSEPIAASLFEQALASTENDQPAARPTDAAPTPAERPARVTFDARRIGAVLNRVEGDGDRGRMGLGLGSQ